ncbi:MAG: flavodoxin domain-containing protein [Pseudonocardiaceae bacterium]
MICRRALRLDRDTDCHNPEIRIAVPRTFIRCGRFTASSSRRLPPILTGTGRPNTGQWPLRWPQKSLSSGPSGPISTWPGAPAAAPDAAAVGRRAAGEVGDRHHAREPPVDQLRRVGRAHKIRRGLLPRRARWTDRVRDLCRYDAVVLGSAIHNQEWLPQAIRFVRRNLDALAARPVWLFSAGMPGALPRATV